MRLAIARAAASADGTDSRALACVRLHGSRRAARTAHTGTRMRVAMAHSFHGMPTRPHGPMAIIILHGGVRVMRRVKISLPLSLAFVSPFNGCINIIVALASSNTIRDKAPGQACLVV